MGNIRFMYDNQWDIGTVAATAENPNFPATNTQHRWWQKTWRNTGDLTDWIYINLPTKPDVKVVVLKYNNFSAAANVDLDGDSHTPNFPSVEFNQPLNTISQNIMIAYFAKQNLQYWRVLNIEPSLADGYMEIGRIFLGSYFEPTRNFALGGGRQGRSDPSVLTVGEEGHIASVLHTKLWTFEYSFPYVTAADLVSFSAMFEAMGLSRGFFITEDLAYPDSSTYYVRFAQPMTITPHFAGEFSVSMSLVESM